MPVINGSSADDYLVGTEGDDTINAGTGVDTVHGNGGNDLITFTAEQHGSGADGFYGGTGVDTLQFDFLFNGSQAALEFNVGATIEGWIKIDNAESAFVSEIEKVTSTFNLGEDHIELTLGATVSPDIHFDIDAGTVPGFYSIRDSLLILAQDLGTGITLTSNNAVIDSNLGTFTNFEVLTVYGSEFADDLSASGLIEGNAALYGGGGNDTLEGTGGADTLFGDAGNDVIHGGAGNDFVGGGAGVDQVYGGDGDDVFLVDSIDNGDVFDGGDGADFLQFSLSHATEGVTLDLTPLWTGGSLIGSTATFTSIEGIAPFEGTGFNDHFVLGANAPQTSGGYYLLTMGAGDDYASGSNNSEVINGNDGNDQLYGLGANDTLYGDDGADQLFGGAGDDWLFGGTGNDHLYGDVGDDLLEGGDGNDYLAGNAGSDHLRGGAGVDTLIAGDGNDFVLVDGQDSADGGAGFDYLAVDMRDATQGQTIDLADTSKVSGFEGVMLIMGSNYDDTISIGGLAYSAPDNQTAYLWNLSNFEGIHGGGGNDLMFGVDTSLASDTLYGDEGNDTLVTYAGNDVLYGGSGDDNLYGGADDDTYYVDSPLDIVFEDAGAGTDTVNASSSYYLFANVENLNLDVFGGNLFGVGNDLANTIIGNNGDNLLIGGGGDDTLDGGNDGNDALFGQDGDDTLVGGTGIDYLVGGIGNDVLDGSYHPDALYGEDGDDVLYGGSDFATDILVGGNGNDVLYGQSGQNDYDLMDGGAGDDTYYVDTGNDLTFEAVGGGTDTVYADVSNVPNAGVYLYANVENLVLLGTTAFGVGNELDNRLIGSAAPNWLLGGAGNDMIDGRGGNDVLFGEGGNDTFAFQLGSGGDVIGDFAHGQDKIDLSAFHFASFAALQNSFHQNGGDGAIDLGGGDFVVLLGTTLSTLDGGDFTL